jgi:hypothetical protein
MNHMHGALQEVENKFQSFHIESMRLCAAFSCAFHWMGSRQGYPCQFLNKKGDEAVCSWLGSVEDSVGHTDMVQSFGARTVPVIKHKMK